MSALSARALPAPTASPLAAADRDVVARLAADAPPLTESTRARLAALLRPNPRGDFTEAFRATLHGGAA